jgi:hypothetical protein
LAIFNNNILLEEIDDLQSSLFMKANKYLDKAKEEKTKKIKKLKSLTKVEKIDTYTQTLELYTK